jgi:hypothetical protein
MDAAVGAAAVTVYVGGDLVTGQNHQALTGTMTAAVAAVIIAAKPVRRRRGVSAGMFGAGRSATALGRSG